MSDFYRITPMKKYLLLTCAAALALGLVSAFAGADQPKSAGEPDSKSAAAAQKYTCPMHPEVIVDKPGKCPKCGMTLVPLKSPEASK
jgi:hypothetical protein